LLWGFSEAGERCSPDASDCVLRVVTIVPADLQEKIQELLGIIWNILIREDNWN
jgi:hypothetical protein